jgi:hypothetical protein
MILLAWTSVLYLQNSDTSYVLKSGTYFCKEFKPTIGVGWMLGVLRLTPNHQLRIQRNIRPNRTDLLWFVGFQHLASGWGLSQPYQTLPYLICAFNQQIFDENDVKILKNYWRIIWKSFLTRLVCVCFVLLKFFRGAAMQSGVDHRQAGTPDLPQH